MKMLQTTLRIAAALFVTCLAGTAYSQQFTVTVNSCNNPSVTGSGTVTLTCGNSSGTPSCTIAPSNPSVLTGASITLNASCSGFTPTQYTWTGCTSAGNTAAQCPVSQGTPGSIPVTLTATDGTSTSPLVRTSVNFSAASCTVTGNNAVTVGNTVTLGLSCNFTPTTYAWLGCTIGGTTSSTCKISSATVGTVPFSVTASDGNGNSAPASGNATFNANVGGIPQNCSYTIYAKGNTTPLSTQLAVIGYGPFTSLTPQTKTPTLGGANMAMLQIVSPSAASSGHGVSWVEFQGLAASRLVYASKTPCDMQKSSLVSAGIEGSIAIKQTGNGGTSGASGGTVNMAGGETWYIMLVDYTQDLTRGSPTFGLPVTNSCPGGNVCTASLAIH